jgi:hypothetical protein
MPDPSGVCAVTGARLRRDISTDNNIGPWQGGKGQAREWVVRPTERCRYGTVRRGTTTTVPSDSWWTVTDAP